MDIERRFDQLETKLDRVADALQTLARIDERQAVLREKFDAYEVELRDIIKRLATVERLTYGRGIFFRWADRVGAVLLGGAVTLLLTNAVPRLFH